MSRVGRRSLRLTALAARCEQALRRLSKTSCSTLCSDGTGPFTTGAAGSGAGCCRTRVSAQVKQNVYRAWCLHVDTSAHTHTLMCTCTE